MHTILVDLRHGLRLLIRNRGFAATAILTLSLGIAATSVIFSVVDSALLKPLPFREPDRLLLVWGRLSGIGLVRDQNGVSPPEFMDLRGREQVFEDVAAYDSANINLTGEGDPERIEAAQVSASFFPVLGVQPVLGRTFTADEDRPGRSNVVVMSQGLWQRRFASDPHIAGRHLQLDGLDYTVLGVMPAGFELFNHADFWTPLAFTGEQLSENDRGSHYLNIIARLKKNVTLQQAQANLDGLAADLLRAHPANYNVDSGWAIRANFLASELTFNTRPAMLVLAGAVSLLLWIACANVANLLLARGAARDREMAVRSALGAGRSRLVRQLLTESVLIGLISGVLGLLINAWSVAALPKLLPLEALSRVQIDGRMLALTFAISMLTSVLFGVLPAFDASRPGESSHRVAGGQRARRMRGFVVVSEIALAVVLLAGAGLLIKSFFRLLSVDAGFNPQGVLTMRVALPAARYPKDHDAVMFFRRATENVQKIPGVESAGFISHLPLGSGSSGCIEIESHPSDPSKKCPEADRRPVTSDYFRAMGIDLVRGRYFDARDEAQETPHVAIVDENLAAQFWPGEDPVGKRIMNGHQLSKRPWLEVVGVVRHVRNRDLSAPSRIQIYWPYSQEPWPFGGLAIRAGFGGSKASGARRRARHPRRGFGAAGVLDPDHGGSDRAIGSAAQSHHGPADRIFRDGSDSRRRRNLWRARVHGRATDPGDRDSHGRGRPRRGCGRPGRSGGSEVRIGGDCGGSRRDARHSKARVEFALRRQSRGRHGVLAGGADRRFRRSAGELHPGAARSLGRPDDRVTPGLD